MEADSHLQQGVSATLGTSQPSALISERAGPLILIVLMGLDGGALIRMHEEGEAGRAPCATSR